MNQKIPSHPIFINSSTCHHSHSLKKISFYSYWQLGIKNKTEVQKRRKKIYNNKALFCSIFSIYSDIWRLMICFVPSEFKQFVALFFFRGIKKKTFSPTTPSAFALLGVDVSQRQGMFQMYERLDSAIIVSSQEKIWGFNPLGL